jgi:hypothetical protein
MSQAGIVDFEGAHPEVPTSFVTNMGTAIPILNVLEVLGTTVAAHGVPLETTGSGNTVTIEAQYASAAATSVAGNAGFASFNSAYFTVDANGYVSLNGSATVESFEVDASTAPGTNPVLPNGSGVVTITGGQVAAGTTGNVIRTNSLAANTYTIQIQRSQAVASSTVGDNGVSHFNSAYFTVDGNGFVSLNGSAVGETITGTTGGPLSPTAGNWNIYGTSTAAGTTPVQTSGTGSTLTVQVQKAQAIASTNASNVGLAAFNSSQFSVDANGFVSSLATSGITTIDGDSGSITGSTVTIYADVAANNCGSTVRFVNSGTTSTLNVTDSSTGRNTFIGLAAGNPSIGIGNFNTGLGNLCFEAITSSSNNVGMGVSALNALTSGTGDNTGIGEGSLSNLVTGSYNTALGQGAGGNYNSSESSNITIGNAGITGDSNVIRIGNQGSGAAEQNKCFIAGIEGVSVSNLNYVTINTATGQLGSVASIPSSITITGDSGSMTGSSLTLYADAAAKTCGATVKFINSGTTSTLNFNDPILNNTLAGPNSGNATLSGTANFCFALGSLTALTSGASNYVFGQGGASLTSGSNNVVLGVGLSSLTTGSNNLVLGNPVGSSSIYTGSESSNVLINNIGVVGESNVMRIGTNGSGTGQQSSCYIAGIAGVSVSNLNVATINTSTGQMGSVASSKVGNWVLIQSQTASSSSSLAFTTGINSTYNTYALVVSNVLAVATSNTLLIQLSTNGGSSYISTGYLSGLNSSLYNSATLTNQNSTTGFLLMNALQTSGPGGSGIFYLQNMTNGAGYPTIVGDAAWATGSPWLKANIGGVYDVASTTVNAFQIILTSTSILQGTFTLYGIVE